MPATPTKWGGRTKKNGLVHPGEQASLPAPYQLNAIHALQRAVKNGQRCFLFEMATGTGKTLTAAAVIKLFLSPATPGASCSWSTGSNWKIQAKKAFAPCSANDFTR